MIGASSLKNYMYNIALYDVFKYKNIRTVDDLKMEIDKEKRFRDVLLSSHRYIQNNNYTKQLTIGIEFEKRAIEKIINKLKIIEDNFNYETKYNGITKKNTPTMIKINDNIFNRKKYLEEYNYTIKMLLYNIPIIYQGVLINRFNNTYGICDLIMKGKYIKKLINNENMNILEDNEYYIIDIKSISLNLDEKSIIKNYKEEYYLGQLIMYNEVLKKWYNNKSNTILIIGNKYKTNRNIELNILNNAGIINYDNMDLEKMNKALEWIKNIENKKLTTPTKEMFLSKKTDKFYENLFDIKNEYNTEIKNIRILQNFEDKNFKMAEEMGIYKWSNDCVSAELFNLKNKKLINSILCLNRRSKNNTDYYENMDIEKDIYINEYPKWLTKKCNILEIIKQNNEYILIVKNEEENYIKKYKNITDLENEIILMNGAILGWKIKRYNIIDFQDELIRNGIIFRNVLNYRFEHLVNGLIKNGMIKTRCIKSSNRVNIGINRVDIIVEIIEFLKKL